MAGAAGRPRSPSTWATGQTTARPRRRPTASAATRARCCCTCCCGTAELALGRGEHDRAARAPRARGAGRRGLARAAGARPARRAAGRAAPPRGRPRRRRARPSTTPWTASSSAPRTSRGSRACRPPGVAVEADRAQRARDLGEPDAERDAIGLRRPPARARAPPRPRRAGRSSAPGEATAAGRARARARARPDPAAWAPRPTPGTGSSAPTRRALARWREAEAHLARDDRAGGRRGGAARRSTCARALGATAGSQGEVEGLVAPRRGCGRRRRPPAARRRAHGRRRADDPFGLTPRERQVLALVARGRDEPRDRRRAVHGREDRERPRLADPGQARRPHADPGGRARAPARPGGLGAAGPAAGAARAASKGGRRRCPLPAAPPRRAPAGRPSLPRRPSLPVLDQRQLDILGLGLDRAGPVPRLPGLPGLGRRRRRRRARGRAALGDRRGRLRRAARRRGHRRRARAAAGAARRAPAALGRAVPAGRRDAGLRRRHARARPGRDARRPVDRRGRCSRAAACSARRCARRRRRRSPSSARTSSPSSCSSPASLLLTGATRGRACCGRPPPRSADTTRALRRPPRAEADDVTERPRSAEPEPDGEPVVRRRRPAPGTLDGAARFPDLFGAPIEAAFGGGAARRRGRAAARARARRPSREPEPPSRSRAPTRRRPRTSRSRSTSSRATSSTPCRTTASSSARSPEQAKPDTAGQEKTAARLVEALGHLGVEAKVIGAVAGPHITRYELQLAPGREDGQGRQPQERPGLRAGGHGDPHPGADPRQAGGRRRGAQPQPADRHARRRPRRAAEGLVAAHRVAGQGRQRPAGRRRPGRACRTCSWPARPARASRAAVNAMLSSILLRATPAEVAARARRSQAGRAQPLRGDPAPADAGHHEPADGRQRAAEPRPRDGVALRRHVDEAHALARRAQQGPPGRGRAGAALRPVRHRRARRPDDGRARPTSRTRSSAWPRRRARSASTSCWPRRARAWTSSRA